MDFWFGIIIVGCELLCCMAYIIYFIADLAHPEDTDFGRSKLMRIAIFLGFLASFSSMLMVQVDVALSSHNNSPTLTKALWIIVILIQISYVFIIGPLLIVYYGSNENETFLKRIAKSFRAQLPLFVTLLLMVIPTYFSKLAYYDLPPEIAA